MHTYALSTIRRFVITIGILAIWVVGAASPTWGGPGDCIRWEDQCDANGKNCFKVCAEWDLSLEEPYVVQKSGEAVKIEIEDAEQTNDSD